MAHRVLAVDPRYNHPTRKQLMKEYLGEGFELILPESFEPEVLLREAVAASAIVTAFAPISADLMAAAPNLRVVGKAGTGVDSIDVAAATAAGIPVVNAPGWMRATSVAEHAFTLMLMASRRPWLWREKRPPALHNQLEGTRLGIVGLGNIGRGVARRGAAFDMEILAHTRTRGKFHPQGFSVEETQTLEELLPRADYLVLSLPLTPESRGLIGPGELARMKKTAFLINVARGPIVVTDALVEALREGRLAGAGLDVTDPEPLPENHPLWGMPNVVISPHIAAQTERVQRMSYQLLCESVRLAVNGERVKSLANPEVYG